MTSAYTHVRDYRRPTVVGGPLVDYAGSNLGATLPKNKATTTLDWNYSDYTAAVPAPPVATTRRPAPPPLRCRAASMPTTSSISHLGYTGIENLTL